MNNGNCIVFIGCVVVLIIAGAVSIADFTLDNAFVMRIHLERWRFVGRQVVGVAMALSPLMICYELFRNYPERAGKIFLVIGLALWVLGQIAFHSWHMYSSIAIVSGFLPWLLAPALMRMLTDCRGNDCDLKGELRLTVCLLAMNLLLVMTHNYPQLVLFNVAFLTAFIIKAVRENMTRLIAMVLFIEISGCLLLLENIPRLVRRIKVLMEYPNPFAHDLFPASPVADLYTITFWGRGLGTYAISPAEALNLSRSTFHRLMEESWLLWGREWGWFGIGIAVILFSVMLIAGFRLVMGSEDGCRNLGLFLLVMMAAEIVASFCASFNLLKVLPVYIVPFSGFGVLQMAIHMGAVGAVLGLARYRR